MHPVKTAPAMVGNLARVVIHTCLGLVSYLSSSEAAWFEHQAGQALEPNGREST